MTTNHQPENHIIYKLYKNIPNNIKNEAISWGWYDTVVRDDVYEWLGGEMNINIEQESREIESGYNTC